MRSCSGIGGCFLLLFVVSGCGASADSLLKSQISDLNALADAIESGASASEIKAIQERLKTNGEKLNNMKLSEDESKKLLEKHKDELAKAMGRYMKAMMTKGIEGRREVGIPGFDFGK